MFLTTASARTSDNNKDEYDDERYDIETNMTSYAVESHWHDGKRKNPAVLCFSGECLGAHGLRLNAE
jgi:hypothetical protein